MPSFFSILPAHLATVELWIARLFVRNPLIPPKPSCVSH